MATQALFGSFNEETREGLKRRGIHVDGDYTMALIEEGYSRDAFDSLEPSSKNIGIRIPSHNINYENHVKSIYFVKKMRLAWVFGSYCFPSGDFYYADKDKRLSKFVHAVYITDDELLQKYENNINGILQQLDPWKTLEYLDAQKFPTILNKVPVIGHLMNFDFKFDKNETIFKLLLNTHDNSSIKAPYDSFEDVQHFYELIPPKIKFRISSFASLLNKSIPENSNFNFSCRYEGFSIINKNQSFPPEVNELYEKIKSTILSKNESAILELLKSDEQKKREKDERDRLERIRLENEAKVNAEREARERAGNNSDGNPPKFENPSNPFEKKKATHLGTSWSSESTKQVDILEIQRLQSERLNQERLENQNKLLKWGLLTAMAVIGIGAFYFTQNKNKEIDSTTSSMPADSLQVAKSKIDSIKKTIFNIDSLKLKDSTKKAPIVASKAKIIDENLSLTPKKTVVTTQKVAKPKKERKDVIKKIENAPPKTVEPKDTTQKK